MQSAPKGIGVQIAEGAFRDCVGMKYMNFYAGKTILSIGAGAFKNNASLQYVSNVTADTKIHPSAFEGCTSLDPTFRELVELCIAEKCTAEPVPEPVCRAGARAGARSRAGGGDRGGSDDAAAAKQKGSRPVSSVLI